MYTGSALMRQWALAGCIILASGMGWLAVAFGFGPEGLKNVIPSLGLVLGFILFREFIRRVCFAWMNMTAALGIDAIVFTLQIAVLCVLALSGKLSVVTAFWSIGGACMVASFVWLLLGQDSYSIEPKWFVADLASNWTLGKWVFAGVVLWIISMTINSNKECATSGWKNYYEIGE